MAWLDTEVSDSEDEAQPVTKTLRTRSSSTEGKTLKGKSQTTEDQINSTPEIDHVPATISSTPVTTPPTTPTTSSKKLSSSKSTSRTLSLEELKTQEEFVGTDEDEGNRSPREQANLAFTMGQQLTDQLQTWTLYKGMQILSMEGYPTLLGHTLVEFKDLERENEDLRQEVNQLKAEVKSTNELQEQLDEVTELARKYKRKAKHQYKQREMVEPSSSVQDKEEEDLEEEAVIEEGLVVDLLKAAQDGVTAAQDLSLKAWEGIVSDTVDAVTSPTKKKKKKAAKTLSSPGPSLPVKSSSPKTKKTVEK
ncbi:hypothetical protein R1sor_016868 [Riccia sorocarpa]|uniref:Uncharacterized protein n=1 Tax=Riccia sorocarpa TaxID=122646 RepID=A0ABD3HMG1_9MARC